MLNGIWMLVNGTLTTTSSNPTKNIVQVLLFRDSLHSFARSLCVKIIPKYSKKVEFAEEITAF
jgi:hypothetical protein